MDGLVEKPCCVSNVLTNAAVYRVRQGQALISQYGKQGNSEIIRQRSTNKYVILFCGWCTSVASEYLLS